MRNPFVPLFQVFAVLSVLCGLMVAFLADGGIYDVRGLIAALAVISASLHLWAARQEARQ